MYTRLECGGDDGGSIRFTCDLIPDVRELALSLGIDHEGNEIVLENLSEGSIRRLVSVLGHALEGLYVIKMAGNCPV